jgi:hypothetical protein
MRSTSRNTLTLRPDELAVHFRDPERAIGADVRELDLLLQAINRHVEPAPPSPLPRRSPRSRGAGVPLGEEFAGLKRFYGIIRKSSLGHSRPGSRRRHPAQGPLAFPQLLQPRGGVSAIKALRAAREKDTGFVRVDARGHCARRKLLRRLAQIVGDAHKLRSGGFVDFNGERFGPVAPGIASCCGQLGSPVVAQSFGAKQVLP